MPTNFTCVIMRAIMAEPIPPKSNNYYSINGYAALYLGPLRHRRAHAGSGGPRSPAGGLPGVPVPLEAGGPRAARHGVGESGHDRRAHRPLEIHGANRGAAPAV